MPHDLFGDAVVRPASRTALRRALTVASIALHAFVIATVVVAQLFAIGPLPTPRRPLAFEDIRMVQLAEIELPPPPRRATAPAATVSPDAAPTEMPSGITRETGLENVKATPARPENLGLVEGERGGIGSFGFAEGAASPPPPPPPTAPVRLHAGIQPPKRVVDVTPTYPEIAVRARVEGIVILDAIIDSRGNVESARILRSMPLLDAAALDAVRQWKYTPALLNGVPVPVIMTVTVRFTLNR
jgi:periplasmic protein TonB